MKNGQQKQPSETRPKAKAEKKSETIEVRVSYTEKLAFMEACRQAGTTASHAIRDYIGDVLSPGGGKNTNTRLVAVAGLTAVIGLALAAAYFSLRDQAPPTTGERVVRYFDGNADGLLTSADANNAANAETVNWLLATADQNGDDRVGAEEINALADVVIELRSSQPAGNEMGGHSGSDEKIIIIPPNLTPSERQALLDQSATGVPLSAEDQARLERLLDALRASSAKAEANKPN